MEQNTPSPLPEAPKKSNTGLIIGIVVAVLLCCCCIAGIAAVYFGYDYLDPFGLYVAISPFPG